MYSCPQAKFFYAIGELAKDIKNDIKKTHIIANSLKKIVIKKVMLN